MENYTFIIDVRHYFQDGVSLLIFYVFVPNSDYNYQIETMFTSIFIITGYFLDFKSKLVTAIEKACECTGVRSLRLTIRIS